MRTGHDAALVEQSRSTIHELRDPLRLRDYLLAVIEDHHTWRAQGCINLIAAESPASPAVRALLATDLGCRASGGHIGRANRYFAGLDHADRMEALCVALLTMLFDSRHADQRLLGGMHGDIVVFSVLSKRGGRKLMSLGPRFGGDTSNRENGPAGVLGMEVYDIPVESECLTIELNQFEDAAKRVKPDVVSLGAGLTLFPYPVKEMKQIIRRWSGRLYFDAAHQAGLIAGRCYPNPLLEGADILTGSTGKTFSGPQGGLVCWNDDQFSDDINEMIFPTLTGTHQLNRVAALTLACLEQLAFGRQYMAQVVRNAQILGAALEAQDLLVIGSRRGFTETHQVVLDVGDFGGGHAAAQRLSEANVVANKVSLPSDRSDDTASGLRFGTVEVTRLGMRDDEMRTIGALIGKALRGTTSMEDLKAEVVSLRKQYSTLYYNFENDSPVQSTAGS